MSQSVAWWTTLQLWCDSPQQLPLPDPHTSAGAQNTDRILHSCHSDVLVSSPLDRFFSLSFSLLSWAHVCLLKIDTQSLTSLPENTTGRADACDLPLACATALLQVIRQAGSGGDR